MMRRLKVYFIHSSKIDYKNLIYKPILQSSTCLMHELILPMTPNYEDKYAKDLIESSDVVVAIIDEPSFGLNLELKWLSKTNKPRIYLSFHNQIPNKYKKYVDKLKPVDENKVIVTSIEKFLTEQAEIIPEEQRDKTIVLGEI